jgi:hypothetical protein
MYLLLCYKINLVSKFQKIYNEDVKMNTRFVTLGRSPLSRKNMGPKLHFKFEWFPCKLKNLVGKISPNTACDPPSEKSELNPVYVPVSNSVQYSCHTLRFVTFRLRFTCCGKVNQLDELVEELLVVADKYGVDDLKDICARNMCDTLTAENVCYRLIIADLYKMVSVKNAAFQFVKDNGRDMMQINGVKDLFATNSALAMELCSALTTF